MTSVCLADAVHTLPREPDTRVGRQAFPRGRGPAGSPWAGLVPLLRVTDPGWWLLPNPSRTAPEPGTLPWGFSAPSSHLGRVFYSTLHQRRKICNI